MVFLDRAVWRENSMVFLDQAVWSENSVVFLDRAVWPENSVLFLDQASTHSLHFCLPTFEQFTIEFIIYCYAEIL